MALEAVATSPVVVIVAVTSALEAVAAQRVVNPNPMPISWDAWRHRPLGFGSVNVPPGYARGHEPRGFGRFNVLLGYARGHGPQRFGHMNVSGSVSSVGPPTKFSQR